MLPDEIVSDPGKDVKTIGLLGGMSWESSIEYERLINQETRARLGGTHSADLIARSYDFAAVEQLQERDAWGEAADLLAGDAAWLEGSGAGVVVLCTNTMHRVADAIEAVLTVPFVHIADATAADIRRSGASTVALLGTRYTMEQAFYRDRLASHGIEVVIPDADRREIIHRVIYDELVRGVITEGSRAAYLEIIESMVSTGCDGVVAGCTEIELLVRPDDVDVPYFPTTAIHARAAVDAALAPDGSPTP